MADPVTEGWSSRVQLALEPPSVLPKLSFPNLPLEANSQLNRALSLKALLALKMREVTKLAEESRFNQQDCFSQLAISQREAATVSLFISLCEQSTDLLDRFERSIEMARRGNPGTCDTVSLEGQANGIIAAIRRDLLRKLDILSEYFVQKTQDEKFSVIAGRPDLASAKSKLDQLAMDLDISQDDKAFSRFPSYYGREQIAQLYELAVNIAPGFIVEEFLNKALAQDTSKFFIPIETSNYQAALADYCTFLTEHFPRGQAVMPLLSLINQIETYSGSSPLQEDDYFNLLAILSLGDEGELKLLLTDKLYSHIADLERRIENLKEEIAPQTANLMESGLRLLAAKGKDQKLPVFGFLPNNLANNLQAGVEVQKQSDSLNSTALLFRSVRKLESEKVHCLEMALMLEHDAEFQADPVLADIQLLKRSSEILEPSKDLEELRESAIKRLNVPCKEDTSLTLFEKYIDPQTRVIVSGKVYESAKSVLQDLAKSSEELDAADFLSDGQHSTYADFTRQSQRAFDSLKPIPAASLPGLVLESGDFCGVVLADTGSGSLSNSQVVPTQSLVNPETLRLYRLIQDAAKFSSDEERIAFIQREISKEGKSNQSPDINALNLANITVNPQDPDSVLAYTLSGDKRVYSRNDLDQSLNKRRIFFSLLPYLGDIAAIYRDSLELSICSAALEARLSAFMIPNAYVTEGDLARLVSAAEDWKKMFSELRIKEKAERVLELCKGYPFGRTQGAEEIGIVNILSQLQSVLALESKVDTLISRAKTETSPTSFKSWCMSDGAILTGSILTGWAVGWAVGLYLTPEIIGFFGLAKGSAAYYFTTALVTGTMDGVATYAGREIATGVVSNYDSNFQSDLQRLLKASPGEFAELTKQIAINVSASCAQNFALVFSGGLAGSWADKVSLGAHTKFSISFAEQGKKALIAQNYQAAKELMARVMSRSAARLREVENSIFGAPEQAQTIVASLVNDGERQLFQECLQDLSMAVSQGILLDAETLEERMIARGAQLTTFLLTTLKSINSTADIKDVRLTGYRRKKGGIAEISIEVDPSLDLGSQAAAISKKFGIRAPNITYDQNSKQYVFSGIDPNATVSPFGIELRISSAAQPLWYASIAGKTGTSLEESPLVQSYGLRFHPESDTFTVRNNSPRGQIPLGEFLARFRAEAKSLAVREVFYGRQNKGNSKERYTPRVIFSAKDKTGAYTIRFGYRTWRCVDEPCCMTDSWGNPRVLVVGGAFASSESSWPSTAGIAPNSLKFNSIDGEIIEPSDIWHPGVKAKLRPGYSSGTLFLGKRFPAVIAIGGSHFDITMGMDGIRKEVSQVSGRDINRNSPLWDDEIDATVNLVLAVNEYGQTIVKIRPEAREISDPSRILLSYQALLNAHVPPENIKIIGVHDAATRKAVEQVGLGFLFEQVDLGDPVRIARAIRSRMVEIPLGRTDRKKMQNGNPPSYLTEKRPVMALREEADGGRIITPDLFVELVEKNISDRESLIGLLTRISDNLTQRSRAGAQEVDFLGGDESVREQFKAALAEVGRVGFDDTQGGGTADSTSSAEGNYIWGAHQIKEARGILLETFAEKQFRLSLPEVLRNDYSSAENVRALYLRLRNFHSAADAYKLPQHLRLKYTQFPGMFCCHPDPGTGVQVGARETSFANLPLEQRTLLIENKTLTRVKIPNSEGRLLYLCRDSGKINDETRVLIQEYCTPAVALGKVAGVVPEEVPSIVKAIYGQLIEEKPGLMWVRAVRSDASPVSSDRSCMAAKYDRTLAHREVYVLTWEDGNGVHSLWIRAAKIGQDELLKGGVRQEEVPEMVEASTASLRLRQAGSDVLMGQPPLQVRTWRVSSEKEDIVKYFNVRDVIEEPPVNSISPDEFASRDFFLEHLGAFAEASAADVVMLGCLGDKNDYFVSRISQQGPVTYRRGEPTLCLLQDSSQNQRSEVSPDHRDYALLRAISLADGVERMAFEHGTPSDVDFALDVFRRRFQEGLQKLKDRYRRNPQQFLNFLEHNSGDVKVAAKDPQRDITVPWLRTLIHLGASPDDVDSLCRRYGVSGDQLRVYSEVDGQTFVSQVVQDSQQFRNAFRRLRQGMPSCSRTEMDQLADGLKSVFDLNWSVAGGSRVSKIAKMVERDPVFSTGSLPERLKRLNALRALSWVLRTYEGNTPPNLGSVMSEVRRIRLSNSTSQGNIDNVQAYAEYVALSRTDGNPLHNVILPEDVFANLLRASSSGYIKELEKFGYLGL